MDAKEKAEAERKGMGGISYDTWLAKNKHKKLPLLKEKYEERYVEPYEGTLTFEKWLQQK